MGKILQRIKIIEARHAVTLEFEVEKFLKPRLWEDWDIVTVYFDSVREKHIAVLREVVKE